MQNEGVEGADEQEGDGHEASSIRALSPEESWTVLRAVVDAVPDLVVRVALDGTILFANKALSSFDPSEGPARTVFDFLDPSDRAVVRGCLDRAAESGRESAFEAKGQGTFGPRSHYHARVSALSSGGRVTSLVIVATDITGVRQARAAIEESEAKLRVAVTAAGMGLFSWDIVEGRMHWDATLCAMFGVPESEAPRDVAAYLSMVHHDDRAGISAAFEHARQSSFALEHRVIRPEGRVRWLMCKGAAVRDAEERVIKLVGGMLDVTERKELEERMRHAQKMDAVGQLTAGIAHNFNNMLTGILPSVELALRDASQRSRPFLENARDAAMRAARMVRQLLVFAGADASSEKKPEAISAVVERTVEFFGATLERHIVLEIDARSDIPLVSVDATQLEQAVLNVLINARDAFEGASERHAEIRVRVYAVERSDPELAPHPDAEASRYVIVCIEDNGVGMTEATQKRVFEPFFTTKEVGRGTGLGLAMVYGVMREHHGFAHCVSRLGEGTKLVLALPAMETVIATKDARQGSSPRESAPASATVLLVDDEEVVVSAVAAILADAGYRVLTARDGVLALETYGRHGDEIDVVLLDQSLPGLSGLGVLEQLRRRNPKVRVISFSGHASPLPLVAASLEKPVDARRLLEVVEYVLKT